MNMAINFAIAAVAAMSFLQPRRAERRINPMTG